MSEQANPVFSIEKIYVKDLSAEVPNAPQIYLEREAPDIAIQLQTTTQDLGEGAFEAVLTVTVTAKIGEKVVFLVEVGQGGIFRILNVSTENRDQLLGIGCPNILFPYAREVVSDAVTRAGFAPVVLQPVNFDALYAYRLEQERAKLTQGEEELAGAPPEASIQ